MNAWPAMQQILLDGWILRFSKGFTKRSNCIVPIYAPFSDPSTQSLLEKIRYCENLYAREQLQTVFRLNSSQNYDQLDGLLAERGYEEKERCHVLMCNLEADYPSDISLVTLEQWLEVYCYLTGIGEPASTLHQIILKAIAGDCAFAVVSNSDEPLACGLGVVERELVGLFDIYTHPEHRREGHGRKLVEGLLGWGQAKGASRAYLQVVSDNMAALKLYEGLQFTKSHEYWYRIAP